MVINYFSKWSQLFPANIDLTPLVYQINDFINEMKYKGRFAAFTVGVLDAKTGVTYLCDAGDTKLNIWSAKLRTLVTEDLPNSPAAGPFDSSLVQMKGPYKQVTRPLQRDDVLMLYTDGIEEAKRLLRGPDSREMLCAHIMDPASVFAGYLGDYFNDDNFSFPASSTDRERRCSPGRTPRLSPHPSLPSWPSVSPRLTPTRSPP